MPQKAATKEPYAASIYEFSRTPRQHMLQTYDENEAPAGSDVSVRLRCEDTQNVVVLDL